MRQLNMPVAAVLILFLCTAQLVESSLGDRSDEFQGCLYVCRFNNCSKAEFSQDPYYRVSNKGSVTDFWHWSCNDECRYQCIWYTTSLFLSNNRGVPQFNGKWPFIRILGLEEPASVLFSLFNLFGHCWGLWKLYSNIPSHAPMLKTWQFNAYICMNAWFWSAVFHAKDIKFTECLDYFSAFSMILYSLYALCMRAVGPGQDHVKQSLGAAAIAFFCYHIWYLTHRNFDYGYNMKINVTVGLANGVGWLLWCYPRRERPYVKDASIVVIFAAMSLVLELFDFPPIGWVLDAHALWHLSTAWLPYFWYRFVIADCLYIMQKIKLETDTMSSSEFAPLLEEEEKGDDLTFEDRTTALRRRRSHFLQQR